VVLPVVRQVGEGWEDDPRAIAREHFATNVLRPRLQRLLRVANRSSAREVVAAAPEGEEHDLGLLAAAAAAADAGWRVRYLGARTPTAALERTADEVGAAWSSSARSSASRAEAFLADRPTFAGAAVVLGGSGFIASDVARLPRAVFHEAASAASPTRSSGPSRPPAPPAADAHAAVDVSARCGT
jgi:MerR family transcriptional regulator, light-induced transcriptional regulator